MYLSEMDNLQLEKYIIEQVEDDIAWRNKFVDFDKCKQLYEMRSGQEDADGIPQENKIKGAVEDFLAVAVMNIPKAKLTALKDYTNIENSLEREIRSMVYDTTERTMNSYVRTILLESEYDDILKTSVISDSAVYGVGYVSVDIDERASLAEDFELRDLVSRVKEWTPEDAKRYKFLTKKIKTRYEKTDGVYWQHSIERADDPGMTRVSTVREYTTQSLRRKWKGNKFSDVNRIESGLFPNYIKKANLSRAVPKDQEISAEVTTWSIEHYAKKIPPVSYIDDDGTEKTIEIPSPMAFRLVKTVIAGGALVHKEVSDYDSAVGRLPIVPFYLRESKQHPYGIATPLMLEHSQRYINILRAIAYRSAKKAVSNQAVFVHVPSLGQGDEEELDRVLESGGVGKIRGNNIQGPVDIREMVMPVYNASAPLSPSIIQAIRMEEEAFGNQAQSLDLDALASARSGSAKRAQASVNDRPKTISISLLGRAVQRVYELVYENIRVHQKERFKIDIRESGGNRYSVFVNDPYSMRLPFLDDMGNAYEDPMNPGSIIYQQVDVILNDTSIVMKAEAEGRGNMPIDPIQRLQYATMLEQGQFIGKKYAREIVLDDDQIARDDVLREQEKREAEEEQKKMLMMQMQMQQMQKQNPSQPPATPNGSAMPSLPTSGNTGVEGLGITDNDNASDVNYL